MSKNDANWIKKTFRKNTLLKFKELKNQFDEGDFDIDTDLDAFLDKDLKINKSHRASDAEEKAVRKETKVNARKSRVFNNGETAKPNQQMLEVAFEDLPENNEDGEDESEYETDSQEEEEEEDADEEDLSELNEINFSRLLELRVKDINKQLEAFCLRYIFTLEKTGVKKIHDLADEFENVCKEIYIPILSKGANPKAMVMNTQKEITNYPREIPLDNQVALNFLKKHEIAFENKQVQDQVFQGIHVMENICFLQFLLLFYRDRIIEQYCIRWEKKKEDLDKKNYGMLLLEEFFMPPLKVEPKLDTELVKYSKLMATRQYEIEQFHKKMTKKEPNSVAYNVLKNELHKYKTELEEKLNVSEIYIAAAIMKLKQRQEKEMAKVFDEIEKEDDE